MSHTNGVHAKLLAKKLDLFKPQIDMIEEPNSWPCWPFLPLRRRPADGGEWELGVLFDGLGYSKTPGMAFTVFLVNITQIGTSIPSQQSLLEQPSLAYRSVEELLAGGWRID